MKPISLIVVLFLSVQSLFAWGQNGHRVIAQICYNNLSPAAKEAVDEALGDNYLTQVTNWPDFIKAEKGWDFAKPWHYMTVQPERTVDDTQSELAKKDKIDNVMEAIELMQQILQQDQASIDRFQEMMDDNRVEPLAGSMQATALAFLIHFVGDLHQPMHVGKNRDLGGNKIKVMYFKKESNVHRVWDTDMIEGEKLSYTELAAFVEIHTRSIKESCVQEDMVTWASESVALRERIYNTLYDYIDRETGLPSFSYQYQHDFLPEVEYRLGAAGYRAAALLNEIFE